MTNSMYNKYEFYLVYYGSKNCGNMVITEQSIQDIHRSRILTMEQLKNFTNQIKFKLITQASVKDTELES